MTRIYKSVRGKGIDLDKIKLKNENSITVGNMKINARGDLIGRSAQVVAGRNQIMDKVYAVPDAPYSPTDPTTHKKKQLQIDASNARQLAELTNNLTVPTSSVPPAESIQPAARGNLASSVAKPTTVTQEPVPSIKEQSQNKGPSRI